MRLSVAIVSVSLAAVVLGRTPFGLVATWQLVSRVDTDPSSESRRLA
jgi:hypothetical protein